MKTRKRPRAATVRHPGLAALLCALVVLSGCRQRSAPPQVNTSNQPVSHRVEEGPVQATITLAPRAVRTSGSVRLRIEVTAPTGATVQRLDLGDALPQDWTITDLHHTTPDADSKQRTERYEYTIEPYLPGHFEIQPFEIRCDLKGDAGGDEDRVTLHTIAVPVEVTSEWAQGESTGEPAALRGVVDPRPAPWPWWAWAGVGGGVALLAAIIALLIARARRPYVPEPILKPAHEIALSDLGRLVAEQLIERGQHKAFYQRISGILRRYIENRFHLRAPEQTTEEFLEASRSAHFFNVGDLQLLEEFLTQCDMVKFAEHEPVSTQMRSTLETVRAFIERTRSDDAMVEISREDGAVLGPVNRPVEASA